MLRSLVLITSLCFSVVYAEPTPERKAELRHLLVQDCGSCHGLTLQGGLGPSLLPEALQTKSDDLLVTIIMEGKPGTPMPPWRGLLTENEVRWLVTVMRSGVKP